MGGFGGRIPADDEEDLSSGRQSPQQSANSSRMQVQGQSGGEEKKTKKAKNGKQPEYLCRNCGRNDSPEWRKVGVDCRSADTILGLAERLLRAVQGPLGAKTLCNACGLRWAKRNAGPTAKKPKDKTKEPKSEAERSDSRLTGNLQM
jgi:hypothetical protein